MIYMYILSYIVLRVYTIDTYDHIEADRIFSLNDMVVTMITEDWCDTCSKFSNSYGMIADRVRGIHPQVGFIKVDLKKSREASTFYSADSLPHFNFILKGTPISYTGAVEASSLERWLIRTIVTTPIELNIESM